MYNLNRQKKIIRRNDMCSNASITEILGINDKNLGSTEFLSGYLSTEK